MAHGQIRDYQKKLESLAQEALIEISSLKRPVIQFCGPISTGGFGNIKDNLECMSSFIKKSQIIGISVFDQIKFERRMDGILKEHEGYDYPLLDFFYKPILLSGHIDGLVFLPLWQTSTGSKWEHDFAKTNNIPTFCIENMLIDEVIIFYNSLKNKKS